MRMSLCRETLTVLMIKSILKIINSRIGRKTTMNITQNTLTVNGLEYVLKSSVHENTKAESKDGMEYKIIRGDRSGVFSGYVKSLNGKEAVIYEARRLWFWSGAASLSQLAIDGTTKPNDCKFPESVSKIQLTDVIELLDVTDKAKKSNESVKVWRQ